MFKSYVEDYILRDRSRTALFFVIAAAVFFIDKLTLGPFAPVQLHDVFETDLPRYKPMGELLFKHGLYFWYPNWPGGAPAYAWHHTPFYILNIAAQIMPLWVLYGAMVIVMMAVAGYGMYRFLCGYLQIDGWVAAVGGLFFALNMQLSSQFFLYTFSYAFPLYFAWAYDFHKGGGKVLKLIILNLLVALSYPVLTLPYFVILELLVIVLLQPQGQNARVRMLIRTAFVWFGYILICVPVIYGLYKYIPYSHRTYQYEAVAAIGILRTLHNGLSGHLLTTMTLIPLAGAMAIAGKVQRVRRGLIVAGVVVLLYAVFSSGVKMIFRGTLFEKMDLGHINTVFPMAMTMAAFIAIDAVIKDRRLLRRYLIGAAFGAGYSVLAVFIFKALETQAVNYFILNIVSGVVIALMIVTAEGFTLPKLVREPVGLITGLTAIVSVFYFSPRVFMKVDAVSAAPVLCAAILILALTCYKFFNISESWKRTGPLLITLCVILFFQVRFVRFFGEESVPYISIMPQVPILDNLRNDNADGPFRVASIDLKYIPMVQKSGFETPDGRGPLFNKYYREFIGILRAPQLENFVIRHDFNTNWYNLFISDGFAGFYLYPFAFLNNRYFVISVDTSGTNPNDDFKLIYTGTTTDDYKGIFKNIAKLYSKPFSIIKCNLAFNRWYLVKKTTLLKSDEDVKDAILKSEGEGLINTVYYSKSSLASDAPMPQMLNGELSSDDRIAARHYSPDEIRLDIETTSPAALVLSNNYDPHWKAYIDGKATPVLRANLAFQSIQINSAGGHSVVLKYEDSVQRLTLLFIPVGMVVFNYFLIAWRRRSV
ncbi:MAG: YfhO family protein [Candidatus Magnetominusculus sp. LBB02]|nr:YfhO family protein [Candidatus Magnetominusculus sp. LBB02]